MSQSGRENIQQTKERHFLRRIIGARVGLCEVHSTVNRVKDTLASFTRRRRPSTIAIAAVKADEREAHPITIHDLC